MNTDPVILVHTLLISTLVLEKFITDKTQKLVGAIGIASILIVFATKLI